MAQGAAMAVEDGLVLAEMLAAHQPLDQALAGYRHRRRARVAWVQEQTHRRDHEKPALAAERIFRSNFRPCATYRRRGPHAHRSERSDGSD